MSGIDNMDARLVELEMRVAFQDDTIQALNDVVVQQQQQLEQMHRQLKLLSNRQAELSSVVSESLPDVPPPHY